MKSKRPNNLTPNPNHCPPSTFVKLKELDTLQHLVRKYPEVAMDWLNHVQIVKYLIKHRVPIMGLSSWLKSNLQEDESCGQNTSIPK